MKENILLLHGALGSTQQFFILQEKLRLQYHVSCLQFSGHGGLPIDKPFSIDLFVQDILTFMEREHLPAAHIFGYSMGGYAALQFARDHPERVSKILTLGTKFLWDPESAAKEVRMMNPDVIEQKIPHFAVILRERHAPEDWKKQMRYTARMMTELGAGKAMSEDDFRHIRHEVMIGIGAEDHMVSLEESEMTAGWIPHGRLRVIPGCKHPIESVSTDTLASICREWFSR